VASARCHSYWAKSHTSTTTLTNGEHAKDAAFMHEAQLDDIVQRMWLQAAAKRNRPTL